MKFKSVNSFEEEQQKLLESKIKSLPKIGYVDKKLGATILPASEYNPQDDIWDEIYKRKFGDE